MKAKWCENFLPLALTKRRVVRSFSFLELGEAKGRHVYTLHWYTRSVGSYLSLVSSSLDKGPRLHTVGRQSRSITTPRVEAANPNRWVAKTRWTLNPGLRDGKVERQVARTDSPAHMSWKHNVVRESKP
jgi:hypothetical protein